MANTNLFFDVVLGLDVLDLPCLITCLQAKGSARPRCQCARPVTCFEPVNSYGLEDKSDMLEEWEVDIMDILDEQASPPIMEPLSEKELP